MEFKEQEVRSLDLIGPERIMNQERLGNLFLEFIAEYKTTHKSYLHRLSGNITQGINSLVVRMEDLGKYSQILQSALERSPLSAIEAFEAGIRRKHGVDQFQVQLVSGGKSTGLRQVCAEMGNRVIKVNGIVVSCSTVSTKPREVFLVCRNCMTSRTTRDVIPRACERVGCPIDPFVIVPERSIVADVQYGKVQESFEEMPVGETPRHLSIVLEGALVDRISPGQQVDLTGVYVLGEAGGQSGRLRVLGVEGAESRIRRVFSEEEEAEFHRLARENAYERIARSIAPAICGHGDVKKVLACLLFGGTRRQREDGIGLRGDINVLLLGDPGLAKSQLLKFVEMVSPVGVYTSGKGSSAAGLTASVLRDKSGAWFLEGGALVLADGGVCCIDEFDKMRESDRVAIHEAMEQQTISIAKAGITTVLNTRAAVLAAANPAFGRYDDYRAPTENIEFGATILSRFDCIFLLKDSHGPGDSKVAEHVLGLHTRVKGDEPMDDSPADSSVLAPELLKNYILFAKRVNPTLSAEAASKLSRFYVGVRQEVSSENTSPIPITVRQLESLIRISEALARMELTATVTPAHADEAIRLFQLSTMSAVSQGHTVEGMVHSSFFEEVNAVVAKIKEYVPVGSTKRFSDIARAVGSPEAVVKSAVDYLVRQNKMITKDYGRIIVRLP